MQAILPIAASLVLAGCPMVKVLGRNSIGFFQAPAPVPDRITDPVRDDARLSVLWVGHATLLVQIDDKIILTDPVFTPTVGQMSRRLVEPGLAPEHVPKVDLALVSHMHFDHLSLGTLERLEPKIQALLAPRGGLVYIPGFDFETDEVATWRSKQVDGMTITSVPVDHKGFRFGADDAWVDEAFTAWVIEYNGLTVYFGGDSAYAPELFRATRARFENIDVALLAIAPNKPDDFARPNHMSADEAVKAFLDLGAKRMIPMHYDTFAHGLDEIGEPVRLLKAGLQKYSVSPDLVHILPIGGQAVLVPAPRVAATAP